MDVNSMLQISSEGVINALSENTKTVTQTIIPEKYRLYEGNKSGVLQNPAGVCLGPNGTCWLQTIQKAKISWEGYIILWMSTKCVQE
jgi:hypothetical protein